MSDFEKIRKLFVILLSNCCEEEPLDDISFGYDIGAALTASALIQQARDRALNQWFDRQHTVLEEEIERQLVYKLIINYDYFCN